ncbi:MAG: hypothetical protein CML68_13420 [Rhodobacteraceae bacterium]|nr:hypothetical protein [Paracoccaceae bacterium]
MTYRVWGPIREFQLGDWSVTIDGPCVLGGVATMTRAYPTVRAGDRVFVSAHDDAPDDILVGGAAAPENGVVSISIATPTLMLGESREFTLSVSVLKRG